MYREQPGKVSKILNQTRGTTQLMRSDKQCEPLTEIECRRIFSKHWRKNTAGRSGWYFRVLEASAIAAGDQGMLIERPHPDWSVARVSHLLCHDRMNRSALVELAALLTD